MKTYVWKRDLETESPETRDGGQFPQFPRCATHRDASPNGRCPKSAPRARATAQAYAGELPPDEEGGEEESEVR